MSPRITFNFFLSYLLSPLRSNMIARGACVLLYCIAATAQPSGCRCVPPDPCWEAIPWDSLNASVNGRLTLTANELSGCIANLSSSDCSQELNSTDDEFWLSAQPGGYLHTGQFNIWNISHLLPSYSVVAQTEGDFQATVA